MHYPGQLSLKQQDNYFFPLSCIMWGIMWNYVKRAYDPSFWYNCLEESDEMCS